MMCLTRPGPVEGMRVWQGLEAPCQSHPPFPSISQKHDRKKKTGKLRGQWSFPDCQISLGQKKTTKHIKSY